MYAIPFTMCSGSQISWIRILTAVMVPFSNPRMNLRDRYVRALIIEVVLDNIIRVKLPGRVVDRYLV